jgi:hypothetical protein
METADDLTFYNKKLLENNVVYIREVNEGSNEGINPAPSTLI